MRIKLSYRHSNGTLFIIYIKKLTAGEIQEPILAKKLIFFNVNHFWFYTFFSYLIYSFDTQLQPTFKCL